MLKKGDFLPCTTQMSADKRFRAIHHSQIEKNAKICWHFVQSEVKMALETYIGNHLKLLGRIILHAWYVYVYSEVVIVFYNSIV